MEKYKDNELYPFLKEYVARMIYAGCSNPYVIDHLRLGYGIELTEKDITEIMNDV